jgi:YD repeat-containing protein
MSTYATDYQYNLDKQLTQELGPDAVVTARSYDSAGRLDLLTMPTGSLDYEYYPAGCSTPGCAAGKLASITGPDTESLSFTMYTYTANGEILTEVGPEGTTTYTYDAMGSLIAVNLPDGRLIQYITDGRNRRIGKTVNGNLVK